MILEVRYWQRDHMVMGPQLCVSLANLSDMIYTTISEQQLNIPGRQIIKWQKWNHGHLDSTTKRCSYWPPPIIPPPTELENIPSVRDSYLIMKLFSVSQRADTWERHVCRVDWGGGSALIMILCPEVEDNKNNSRINKTDYLHTCQYCSHQPVNTSQHLA